MNADATVRALEQHRAQGLVLNITGYNEAIVANWRANRADVCLELYRQLLKDGVLPNKWTFNAVAGACARRGLAQEVCASLHLDQRRLALPGTYSSSTALSATHVPALFPTSTSSTATSASHSPAARNDRCSALEQGLSLSCRPGRLHPVRGSGVTARAHMCTPKCTHVRTHKRTRTRMPLASFRALTLIGHMDAPIYMYVYIMHMYIFIHVYMYIYYIYVLCMYMSIYIVNYVSYLS